MANPTVTLIASNTVGSGGASSVTFSSIPATYTDLVILSSTRNSVTGATYRNLAVTFNGSASSYTNINMTGSGSAVASYTNTQNQFDVTDGQTSTANTFSNGSLYIPNYNSANYKSSSGDGVSENNATLAYAVMDANLWSNTAAITSVTITVATLAQYSTFYLYGVKNS